MGESAGPTTLPDTVLLVDDEQAVLDVLSLGFKRGGVPVKTALTAEGALTLLDQERFGAVVTDKNLPGKSGLDVIREARARQPHVACVVVTGYVSTESALEAIRLGANDYILKPFDNVMLVVQRVKQAIAHQRVVAERAALGEALRALEKSLRKTEAEAFQKGTELDLFQNVMELRLEDATKDLLTRVAQLESDLQAERDRRESMKRTLGELAGQCRDAAQTVAATSKPAAEGLEKLASRLLAEAEILG